MRDDALPSPGLVSGSRQLRWLAAKAISYIDVNKTAAGKHEQAIALAAFFTACSTALNGFKEIAPTNSVVPTITGTAKVGSVLTANDGTWANNPSFRRQWQANSVNIAGATERTYTPVAGQLGQTIRVVYVGYNSALPAGLTVNSAQTTAVIA